MPAESNGGGRMRFAFMEVSSHAIHQHRIAGLEFAGGLFSNITHDHLDYHKTFDEYIKAKKAFFDGLPSSAFAITNVDDKRGNVMLQNTAAKRYATA
jgi:UDP-N-acetylmuramoyl-L-alanyl-D-glutamate--2,6-diaminopimelate ligase